MKKVLIILCMAFFALPSSNAQFALDVKADPLNPLFGTADFSLEFILNGRVGFELEAGPKFGTTRFLGVSLFKKTGFRSFAAAKYYFSKREIGDQFSLGAYVKYKDVTYTETDDEDFYDDSFNWERLGAGILFSYKHVFPSGFLFGLDLGLGGALSNNFSFIEEDDEFEEDVFGFFSGDLLARAVVGYRLVGERDPEGKKSGGKGKKKKKKKKKRRY